MAGSKESLIAKINDLLRSRPPFCTKAGKLTTQGKFWDFKLRAFGKNIELRNLQIIWRHLDAIAELEAEKKGAA